MLRRWRKCRLHAGLAIGVATIENLPPEHDVGVRPCSCQSSARSSRKRLLNALRVASGDPPGFPENPGANLPLTRPSMTLGAVFDSVFALIVFAWF